MGVCILIMNRFRLFLTFVLTFTAFVPLTFAKDALYLLQDNCVRCHLTHETPGKGCVPLAWKSSVHYGPETGCADCHGGNKFLQMAFKKGHIGIPSGREITDMCGKCHVGEGERFIKRTKFAPAQVKRCEATCITCHDAHTTKKADLSIMEEKKCAACHGPDKASSLFAAIDVVKEKIASIEQQIDTRSKKGFPVTVPIRDLTALKHQRAAAFHSLTSADLVPFLNEDMMEALANIEHTMAGNSPTKWLFQGMAVLLFFFLCLLLLKYYQSTVLPHEDDGFDQQVGSTDKPKTD